MSSQEPQRASSKHLAGEGASRVSGSASAQHSGRTPLAVKNVQSRAAEEAGDETRAPLKHTSAFDAENAIRSPLVKQSPSTTRIPYHKSAHHVAQQTLASANVRTPQKRSIPREDVHARNVVENDDGSPPHKKSRSSKGGEDGSHSSGLAREVEVSAATSQGISNELRQMDVGENTPDKPMSSKLSAVESRKKADDRPSQPHRLPVATTTRIDKHSRMNAAERVSKEEMQRQHTEAWRRKYASAFAKFSFYLDGFDDKTKEALSKAIVHCGGSVEPFFAKTCSHVVCARKPVPPTAASPSTSVSAPVPRRQPAVSAKSPRPFSPTEKSLTRKNTDMPLHSDRNPFEDSASAIAATQASDVVRKAMNWGIRVWSLEKFWTTINTLLGRDPQGNPMAGTSTSFPGGRQDLAKMLEHERIHGTSERDINAPQSGWRYMDKSSIFVMVGDATQEHRAIMFEEFEKPKNDSDEPPWPILYGDCEGRCPFTKYVRKKDREVVDRNENAGAPPEAQAQVETQHDKPSNQTSLQKHEVPVASGEQLRRVQAADEQRASASPAPDSRAFERGASPYQLASGNSVSVASNMTSAVGHFGSTASMGGNPCATPNFALQDKRVAQLGRRIVSAAPNATPDGRHTFVATAMTRSASMPRATNPLAHGALVRQMLGMTNDAAGLTPPSAARGSSQVGIGHPLHAESRLMRSTSMQTLKQHATAEMVAQEQARRVQEQREAEAAAAAQADKERKTMYCENCKKKFHNFDRHIASHEHRKFATDDGNFAGIDRLLNRLQRPIASWVSKPEYQHIIRIADGLTTSEDDEDDEDEEESEEGDVEDYDSEDPYKLYLVDDDEGEHETDVPANPFDNGEQADVDPRGNVSQEASIEGQVPQHQSLECNTSVEGNEGPVTPRTSPEAQRQEHATKLNAQEHEVARGAGLIA